MPTYEYRCLDCGKTFECFQNMNDAELENCLHCNGNVKRLIGSGAGIIFRGSGFYCTDYRNDKSGENSTATKQDTKTENGESGDSDKKGQQSSSGSSDNSTATKTTNDQKATSSAEN